MSVYNGRRASVNLPDDIAHFVRNGTLAVAGTRDDSLVPHVHRPSAWTVEEDGVTVLCLFPEIFAHPLESSLQNNGEIALTVAEAPSHETYQLKGRCIEMGPVTSSDLSLYRDCLERSVGRLVEVYGWDESALRECFPEPTLRVRFAVREIFDQTPGPHAGRRVGPHVMGHMVDGDEP